MPWAGGPLSRRVARNGIRQSARFSRTVRAVETPSAMARSGSGGEPSGYGSSNSWRIPRRFAKSHHRAWQSPREFLHSALQRAFPTSTFTATGKPLKAAACPCHTVCVACHGPSTLPHPKITLAVSPQNATMLSHQRPIRDPCFDRSAAYPTFGSSHDA